MPRGVEQHFGPEGFKAIFQLILEEFNRNRQWHGQPLLTIEQVKSRFKELFDQYTDELEEEWGK
jgi:hypothetical protein